MLKISYLISPTVFSPKMSAMLSFRSVAPRVDKTVFTFPLAEIFVQVILQNERAQKRIPIFLLKLNYVLPGSFRYETIASESVDHLVKFPF